METRRYKSGFTKTKAGMVRGIPKRCQVLCPIFRKAGDESHRPWGNTTQEEPIGVSWVVRWVDDLPAVFSALHPLFALFGCLDAFAILPTRIGGFCQSKSFGMLERGTARHLRWIEGATGNNRQRIHWIITGPPGPENRGIAAQKSPQRLLASTPSPTYLVDSAPVGPG